MTLVNAPFFYLLWIVLGGILLLIGFFRLVTQGESQDYYTALEEEKNTHQSIQELLTYFLEEEEKKNDSFRKMFDEKKNGQETSLKENHREKAPFEESSDYNEMIELYKAGESPENIAKKLGKGIGEVNLILSLYSMR